jgi:putative ABC transport system permease protein
MIIVSLRDLQWRSRRIAIATAGTALVFGLTLLLGSVIHSLSAEIDRTLDGLGIDAVLFPDTSASPFYSLSLIPTEQAVDIEREIGGEVAASILFRQAMELPSGAGLTDVFLFGIDPEGLGLPPLVRGGAPLEPLQVVIDATAGLDIGDELRLGGKAFEVVGLTNNRTLSAGKPTAYVRLADLQHTFLRGTDVGTLLLAKGGRPIAPAGFRRYDLDQAREDMLRPVDGILGSLKVLLALLWVVAACIIGSVLYLSAIERTRDFAVFKATGAGSGQLAIGLALQAVLVSLASAVIAICLALVLAPFFPIDVQVPATQIVLIPIVALVVGLLSSTTGLRRAIAVDPALAFGAR